MYVGTLASGKPYETSEAPVNAGSYKVRFYLAVLRARNGGDSQGMRRTAFQDSHGGVLPSLADGQGSGVVTSRQSMIGVRGENGGHVVNSGVGGSGGAFHAVRAGVGQRNGGDALDAVRPTNPGVYNVKVSYTMQSGYAELQPQYATRGAAGAFCSTFVMVSVEVTGSRGAVPACMVKLTVTG